MLCIDKISKAFGQKQVLKELSCHIESDDFVVVMGPNGTGKSTLFDIISGKTRADCGRVVLDGKEITATTEEERALYFGRLFQNPSLGVSSKLTVRENLAMATMKGRKANFAGGTKCIEERFLSLDTDYHALLDVPIELLSGGQRQMIAFLMATMKRPKLLLLDEPTAALDPVSAKKLLLFLVRYTQQEKVGALLIAHDAQIAHHIGNRLWIMGEGVIKESIKM